MSDPVLSPTSAHVLSPTSAHVCSTCLTSPLPLPPPLPQSSYDVLPDPELPDPRHAVHGGRAQSAGQTPGPRPAYYLQTPHGSKQQYPPRAPASSHSSTAGAVHIPGHSRPDQPQMHQMHQMRHQHQRQQHQHQHQQHQQRRQSDSQATLGLPQQQAHVAVVQPRAKLPKPAGRTTGPIYDTVSMMSHKPQSQYATAHAARSPPPQGQGSPRRQGQPTQPPRSRAPGDQPPHNGPRRKETPAAAAHTTRHTNPFYDVGVSGVAAAGTTATPRDPGNEVYCLLAKLDVHNRVWPICVKEQIKDLQTLKDLEKSDLREIGITMGDIAKILRALAAELDEEESDFE